MSHHVAVAVIHGIGSQKPGYSAPLESRLRKELGAAASARTAVEEVYWADILSPRQDAYLRAIKRKTRYDDLRSFMVRNLSDAVAYRKTTDTTDSTYERIHARLAEAIERLEQQVPEGTPLVIVAHSLGGHIVSNYVYDTVQGADADPHPTAFQNLRTLAGLVTFGCNIPLFVFSYDADELIPIEFPGTDLPESLQIDPWWVNFYDKDDVLGFPLAEIGPGYADLRDRGELREKSINAGRALSAWNPLSHNGYWKDADFVEPCAKFLRRYLYPRS